MRSVAAHIAVAVESVLAINSVEAYQRDLARERDRLSLLREINNEALKAASGQISGTGGAAERLGLKRTTLQNKMRRLGITNKDYRLTLTGLWLANVAMETHDHMSKRSSAVPSVTTCVALPP